MSLFPAFSSTYVALACLLGPAPPLVGHEVPALPLRAAPHCLRRVTLLRPWPLARRCSPCSACYRLTPATLHACICSARPPLTYSVCGPRAAALWASAVTTALPALHRYHWRRSLLEEKANLAMRVQHLTLAVPTFHFLSCKILNMKCWIQTRKMLSGLY